MLAAATILGRAAVEGDVGARWADRWLDCWADRVTRHNWQQQLHAERCTLMNSRTKLRDRDHRRATWQPMEPMPVSRTFADGIREYVSLYGDTAAGAMALVGALPFGRSLPAFTRQSSWAFLFETPSFFEKMNALLRFAQDVRFDPSEPLSCGLFALAAERRCGLVEMDAQSLDARWLTGRMTGEWRSFMLEMRTGMRQACRAWASTSPRDPETGQGLSGVLERMVESTCGVAVRLADAPHKELNPEPP